VYNIAVQFDAKIKSILDRNIRFTIGKLLQEI